MHGPASASPDLRPAGCNCHLLIAIIIVIRFTKTTAFVFPSHMGEVRSSECQHHAAASAVPGNGGAQSLQPHPVIAGTPGFCFIAKTQNNRSLDSAVQFSPFPSDFVCFSLDRKHGKARILSNTYFNYLAKRVTLSRGYKT